MKLSRSADDKMDLFGGVISGERDCQCQPLELWDGAFLKIVIHLLDAKSFARFLGRLWI